MQKSKINWTELARIAPNNPATGENYRGQSLKRVADGLRQNVLLYNWLQGNGIRCAKTKEGTSRKSNNTRSKRRRSCISPNECETQSELHEIAKAIRGEAYTFPTDSDHGQRS